MVDGVDGLGRVSEVRIIGLSFKIQKYDILLEIQRQMEKNKHDDTRQCKVKMRAVSGLETVSNLHRGHFHLKGVCIR